MPYLLGSKNLCSLHQKFSSAQACEHTIQATWFGADRFTYRAWLVQDYFTQNELSNL